MGKRFLSLLMVLCLSLSLVMPVVAAPEETDPDDSTVTTTGTAVYVSKDGNDDSGDGSEESPYATLAKAVDAKTTESGATIYVMSDLTMTKCARFYGKHLTITSGEGGPYTLTRGETFAQQQDPARSTYNPAMIEVDSTEGPNTASLTLTNIILDDAGIAAPANGENHYYIQAQSSDGNTEFGDQDINHGAVVQDAIIATYNGVATITLGDGAVLKNYGGMSAVRLSDGKLIMKDGSKIIDDNISERSKGTEIPGTNKEYYGPAGAVWMQGGTLIMEKGSFIGGADSDHMMPGRAVYDEAGYAEVNGTIANLKGTLNMWWGESGVALYTRTDGKAVLGETGVIENITGDHAGYRGAVMTNGDRNEGENNEGEGYDFEAKAGSVIRNVTGFPAVFSNYGNELLDGTIENCTNDYIVGGFAQVTTIGPNGVLQNNDTTKGAAKSVVYTSNASDIYMYGTVKNNKVGTAAFYIINQSGGGAELTIYDGAWIEGTGNNKGVYINASESKCVMNGGTISGFNYGVDCRGKTNRDATFIMNGGTITGNGSGLYFNGISKSQSIAELNRGTIAGNEDYEVNAYGGNSEDAYEHVKIAAGVVGGANTVRLSAGTLTLDVDYADIQLGDAKSDADSKIKELVAKEHSDWKVASSTALWFKPSTSEIHFTITAPSSVSKTGLFAAYIPLNADGTPVEDAQLTWKEFENTDPIDVTLDNLTPGTSYALMFVNNNIYTLAPDDITIYTGGGQGSEDATQNNGFPALTIANSVDEIKSLTIDDQAVTEDDLMAALLGRLEVTYTDENGKPVENDAEAGEYTATLAWKEGQKPTSIRINGNEVADTFGTGTLIVRYVENIDDAVSGDSTHKLLTEEPTTPVEHAEAIAKESPILPSIMKIKFYTNDNEDFEITDTTGISILDDALLTDEDGTDRQALLEEKAEKSNLLNPLGDGQAYRYQFHYLDLVDAHNGNAWVSASYGTTVYLPYPDGVTKDNAEDLGVQVIHYKDLHREYGIAGQADVEAAIEACELETMNVTFDTNGIKFDVDREGFSPFAVVWQTQAYTITATAGNGGTITPSGNVIVAEGEDQSFTITASDGYKIADVKVDGTSVGAVDSYTFEDVKANHSIEATFTKEGGIVPPITYYTITASAGEGGAINPSGTIRVPAGGDRTFTISAAEGYEIADVLVDGKSVGAVDSYTFENVRANHTISVVFQEASGIADPDDTGVSDWLDTDNHKVYLNGYPDDSFQPEKDMTRAEAAQMFYNLLRDQDVETTVSFTDVAADAWYATAVNALASLEIVNGVGDDRFSPERTITRAEFTTMAMRFCDGIPDGENIFSDVDQEDWFYEYVVGSIQYGWINGYPDGTFRPNDTISRAEVTTITNRMLGRAADEVFVDQHQDSLRIFTDLKDTHWAYHQIVEATNAHEYTKDNGTEDWTKLV